MDEDSALREFGEPGDELFRGTRSLPRSSSEEASIVRCSWRRRGCGGSSPGCTIAASRRPGWEATGRSGSHTLNTFLYYTVGGYVRMKAYLLNRRYRSRGDVSSVFRVRIGSDHCVYESNRYQRLRGMYSKVGADAEA